MKRLLKENGEEAGLWDVCAWWMETYPDDIFISDPPEVVEIRNQMLNLAKRTLNRR
jgi:hypothetical protein